MQTIHSIFHLSVMCLLEFFEFCISPVFLDEEAPHKMHLSESKRTTRTIKSRNSLYVLHSAKPLSMCMKPHLQHLAITYLRWLLLRRRRLLLLLFFLCVSLYLSSFYIVFVLKIAWCFSTFMLSL